MRRRWDESDRFAVGFALLAMLAAVSLYIVLLWSPWAPVTGGGAGDVAGQKTEFEDAPVFPVLPGLVP